MRSASAKRSLGTRAHQLALYVVFENPMPMVADYPDAYAGSDPNQLRQHTETVGASQSLKVTLAAAGGVVAVFRPK
jgi:Glycoside hydrolase 97